MCERPDAFQSLRRTARKDHKCCECRETIKKGEQYQYSSGVWDNTPSAHKQCLGCHDIMDSAARESKYYDEGPWFGGLREFFENEMCQSYHGKKFVMQRAGELGCDPEQLAKLLKVDLAI